ncbi:hypothetical protein DsansV1_C01g0005691 [Dioscorea sansibarensis]
MVTNTSLYQQFSFVLMPVSYISTPTSLIPRMSPQYAGEIRMKAKSILPKYWFN